MCGITGLVNTTPFPHPETLVSMTNTLQHRGPEGTGITWLRDGRVGLGHRRLAILDLSQAGQQPMASADGTAWITFNGEIYNYITLRTELQRAGYHFRSNTDTEVVIHAWQHWGTRCPGRLRGMFAFAIFDLQRDVLFAARDHLGVKPFYYRAETNGLRFASELRALLADTSLPRTISLSSVADYLVWGFVPFDRTILNGFHKLPPAHYLLWQAGDLQIQRYWSPEPSADLGGPTDLIEATEVVRDDILDAVNLHRVSDVPIGLLLSGGVDSSGVAAALARCHGCPLPAFTLGIDDPERDERRYARIIAKTFSFDLEEDELRKDMLAVLLHKFVTLYDEPLFDHSGIPTHLVSRLARKRVKVVLSGDGGDEVFAGYRWYDAFAKQFGTRLPQSTYGDVIDFNGSSVSFGLSLDPLEALHAYHYGSLATAAFSLATRAVREANQEPFATCRRFWRPELPSITAMQLFDLQTYLPDAILAKVDRASMSCGLEVRIPLLDRHLVTTAFSIRSDLIYRDGERKHLFKRALRQLGVPNELLGTRKVGFGIPYDRWLVGGAARYAIELLKDGALVQHGLIQPDALVKLTTLPPIVSWILLTLEWWVRQWIDGDKPSDFL